MRQVTQSIRSAFIAGDKKKIGNTETDGTTVWLHGNAIVRKENTCIEFSLAGWNTPTTRERVNGITGVGVYQKNWEAMLDGDIIDTTAWYKIPLTKREEVKC